MIASIRGNLLFIGVDHAVIETGGVGFMIYAPRNVLGALGEIGGEVRLYTHLHIREDLLALYGFATTDQRHLFETLLGVSGIGPKVALAVLSGIEPADLIKAIHRSDLARLTAIPGVGKKTSERIVLELKDRLPAVAPTPAPEGAHAEPTALKDDVMSALVNLGYHRPLAEKAVDAAVKAHAGDFEQTLRQALRELAR